MSTHQKQATRKRNQENKPICNSIRKNKIPRNKFNLGLDLHTENPKTLKKEIEEVESKSKDIPCSWIE